MIAGYCKLTSRTFASILSGFFTQNRNRFYATFVQMVQIGVMSFPTVALACFFMGLVLAMQAADQLQQVGAIDRVADLVAFSMLREIGPLIAGIVIIGRSGSSITAELGTMKVSEEIEALEVMAIDPVRYLVAPRVVALVIMAPCLTILGNALGIFGGWVISTFSLQIDPYLYFSRMLMAVKLHDLYTGVVKSIVFGFLIASIACYYGITVEGGAEGVGRNTTRSVVTCILAMLVADAVLTAIFFFS